MKNNKLKLFLLLNWVLCLGAQIGILVPWLFSQNYIPFLLMLPILGILIYTDIVFSIIALDIFTDCIKNKDK